jgi:putative chitinase
MDFNFTTDMVKAMLPTNNMSDSWFQVFNDNMPAYNINTPQRVAAFISQCAHESCDFTKLHENLNYKATSLITTWPKHFNASIADSYAHNPEKIANRAYANRDGNGDEASGDGWKYRGRGPIQVTGKANYTLCSQAIYQDNRLVDNPDMVETDLDTAFDSAAWFWSSHDLNTLADTGDILGITKKINGGTLGIDDRTSRYNTALSIITGGN